MYIDNRILCDFCFEPISDSGICTKCGLSHNTYKAKPGLLKPGTVLNGKYVIGRSLGRGGFGATYMSYSLAEKRVVAVKEYFPAGITYRGEGEEKITLVSEDSREIFENGARKLFDEACQLSKFGNNDNIVSVYEYFNANDTVYYSMEYLDGCDLRTYINRLSKQGGRLSEKDALKIIENVCKALMEVHDTSLLHRDISPDNIFICRDGRTKLIDFGNAKQVVSNATQKFSVVVKFGFSPPEQFSLIMPQGPWSDIYSLGATLYYVITGKMPPNALDYMDKSDIPLEYDIPVSAKVKAIIKKCMKYRVEERYQSAAELLDAIDGRIIIEESLTEKEQGANGSDTSGKSNGGTSTDSPYNMKLIYGLISTIAVLIVLIIGLTVMPNLSEKEYGDVLTDDVEEISEDAKIKQAKIEEIIHKKLSHTEFGIFVKNLKNDYSFSYNEDKQFAASGLTQIVILDSLSQVASASGINLNTEYWPFKYMANGKESPYSKDEDGAYLPIRRYIEDIAVYGDNNKANSLIDYIGYLRNTNDGFSVINQVLRQNTNGNTNVNRKTYTGSSSNLIDESAPRNMTSAKEIARIFYNLITNGCYGDSDYMRSIFKSVSAEGKPIGLNYYVPDMYKLANANARSEQITSNVAVISNGDTEIMVAMLSCTDSEYTSTEDIYLREAVQGDLIEYILQTQFGR